MKKLCLSGLSLVLWPFGLCAQLVINDNLNGASSSYPWQSIRDACLTAGDNSGTIPSCLSIGRMVGPPDAVGHGVLRLTDNDEFASGGVISQFSFPSNRGLQVNFTTVTYGGNGVGGTGADGMSFFLIDADRVLITANTRLGAWGGALGYSRSRRGVPGMVGGYLGVGIDEFGNFSNPADNGVGGPGFTPNVVALRGSQGTGYRYITGSAVQGPIASTRATSRNDAVPITFNLNITRDGLLNMGYSRQGGLTNPVISNHPITASNGTLPRNFHFGFAASSGGGTNIHEITCFKAASIPTSGSSVDSNGLQAAKVQHGSQLYRALYHTDPWWGQLVAQGLKFDPVTQALFLNPVATWDAHCNLSGGLCASTKRRVPKQAANQRTMLSFDGVQGVPFQWARLSAAQQNALGGISRVAPPRFDYLRGDRTQERPKSLRPRVSVLGDIVNASPTWVGPPKQPYVGVWKDAIYPQVKAPEGSSYRQFASTHATRTNVVYVGANDGMLHGFRSGANNARGELGTKTPNDGHELLAYVPQASVMTLHSNVAQFDYSHPQYAHNAFVDATPGVGDLFYAGAWHTWLVSGMGGGGNSGGVLADNTSVGSGSIFALDITNPGRFAESHANSLVKGEWNASTLQCLTDTRSARCGDNLGNTYGTPVIRRLHDGRWAAIFGNGYNSRTGTAGVFIMTANDNGVSFRFLDTGAGSSGQRNGIAYVTPVDLDADNVVDYLYAGDLQGNVWRFDVSSSDPDQWRVRKAPVFQTGGLPITTQVAAVQVTNDAGEQRLMLDFGTGRIMPQTMSSAAVPDQRTHFLFGVWDWDMAAWNQRGSQQLLDRSAADQDVPSSQVVVASNLTLQEISTNTGHVTATINGVRTMSGTPVCWSGSTACASPQVNDRFGWRVRLPGTLEQVVYNPVVQDGLFQISTAIPAVAQSLTCTAAPPATGYTLAITPDQGLAPETAYFSEPANPSVPSVRAGNVSSVGVVIGLGLSAVGTPSQITSDGGKYLVTQTTRGELTFIRTTLSVQRPAALTSVQRLIWKRLR